MSKIISLHRNLVEMDKIKAISINTFTDLKPKSNIIKVEFKTRKEYIYNPNIELWELEIFNDVLFMEYPDYETAKAYFEEMMDEWQAELDL